MTKRGLWHDVILVRKEYYDVILVHFCIHIKSEPFEIWKINVIDEEYGFEYVKYWRNLLTVEYLNKEIY